MSIIDGNFKGEQVRISVNNDGEITSVKAQKSGGPGAYPFEVDITDQYVKGIQNGAPGVYSQPAVRITPDMIPNPK